MAMRMALSSAVCAVVLAASVAVAQDVPGIENCSAEKAMERRTGCLQSNVDFLMSTLTRAGLDTRRRLDAAARRIEAAQREIAGLRSEIAALRASIEGLQAAAKAKEPAAK